MKASYKLYSNHNTDVHIFMRTDSDGKQSIVSSEEMKIYNRGKRFGVIMDMHHALVRFMFEVVDNCESPQSRDDSAAMETILRVPFDKADEIIKSE